MDWFANPTFRRVCDSVVEDLRRKHYRFRKFPKVILLCGGKDSQQRTRLAEYFELRRSDCQTFQAESAWDVIARDVVGTNALAAEEKLAQLADMVVIIVESAGTIAELGAFAISPVLRKKLLPILDRSYVHDSSFINTGPVSWIDADSHFSPSIWTSRERILENAGTIEERVDRIPPDDLVHEGTWKEASKHLLFFLCDVVAIFGPCTSAQVSGISAAVIGHEVTDVPLMLALAKALGILKSFSDENRREVFFRPLEDGRLESFHYTGKYLSIPDLRARVMSVVQLYPEGRELLASLKRVNGTP